MNPVVIVGTKHIFRGELNISRLHGAQIKLENLAAGTHNHILVDDVDERLFHDGASHAVHVDAIDIVPEFLLLVLVFAILKRGNVDGTLVGQHFSSLDEVFIASPQDRVEHWTRKEGSSPSIQR